MGYTFTPISFLMGVPWDECVKVGKLVGLKTMVNEFVAFEEMSKMVLTVSTYDHRSNKHLIVSFQERTKVIATYAICGFSNPGSIGIVISALSTLVPNKSEAVTRLVFRAFVGGAIVCFMTACIAALLIPDDLI